MVVSTFCGYLGPNAHLLQEHKDFFTTEPPELRCTKRFWTLVVQKIQKWASNNNNGCQ
ncbi:mCG147790 [Mus musculus]|nr:mCG147790 [Mus musculus]